MNIKLLVMVAALLAATISVSAERPQAKLKPSQTVFLYPEGQNSHKGLPETFGPLESNGFTKEQAVDPDGRISYTGDKASFDLYFPKKPNGQMVIICPGGGYWTTSSIKEGSYVAEWLVGKGITACVMNYRMPNGHWAVPLADVQNTFRYCRAHAGEWKISQIGVMGFSAGGHLAASASTLFLDKTVRPDFSILLYPVITMDPLYTHTGTRDNLIGKPEKWLDRHKFVDEYEKSVREFHGLEQVFSLEKQVSRRTPPTFMVFCQDDNAVPVENGLRYFRSLTENNVPTEFHIYPKGGHGWGFATEKYAGKGNDRFDYARKEFEAALVDWLARIKE